MNEQSLEFRRVPCVRTRAEPIRASPTATAAAAITLLGAVVAQAPTDEWVVARDLGARTSHAMAYDVARARVVLFGGLGGHEFEVSLPPVHPGLSDTWEWDGSAWLRRVPATSPPPRFGHALAYDVARRRVVLFGGQSRRGPFGKVPFDDTWVWNGDDWRRLAPATSPPARTDFAMAYDVARARIVLFGGQGASGLLGDTWEWDGATWRRQVTTAGPTARAGHAMAYDAARRRVVLFGGNDAAGPSAETWEWNGATWTLRTPSGASPSARTGHSLSHDAARGRSVLFGGRDATGTLGDTWEWNGAAWTPRTPGTAPGARAGHATAYDVARRCVVLCGGTHPDRRQWLSDTWQWHGGADVWTEVVPRPHPMPRSGHAMAYDRARRRVVLFGGHAAVYPVSYAGETWEWDGGAWKLREPSPSPIARSGHAMAYDAARRRVVLFGGTDQIGVLGDTWEWDGVRWIARSPAVSPPARVGHAMTYDEHRRCVVLFGGSDRSSQLGDTWEWDGVRWRQLVPPASPAATVDAVMAYDGARRRTLLVAQYFVQTPPFARVETWEWDGASWTQRAPSRSPHLVRGARAAFDSSRQRVVLYGYDSVWEWDGGDWRERTTATLPPSRHDHALCYDAGHGCIVLFGGVWLSGSPEGPFREYSDTWRYGALTRAAARPYGTGCAGSAGTPILTATEPVLGSTFSIEALSARALAPSVFVLAPIRANVPVGPCTLLVGDPFALLPALTSALGVTAFRLAAPVASSLRGARLYAQAIVADPRGLASGLAATAGLELVLGD